MWASRCGNTMNENHRAAVGVGGAGDSRRGSHHGEGYHRKVQEDC